MGGGFEHLIKNQIAALNGGNIECIHQMRIALRRLHATLALFKGVIASPGLEGIKRDLQWFSYRLGAARDWDVFETRTLQKLKRTPTTRAAAEGIAKATSAQRIAVDRRAARALRSARYRRFILTTRRWLGDAQWCEHLDPGLRPLLDEPLVEAVRPWLQRSARKVHKEGKGIAHLKAKHRHRLRIALKQLRYDTDSLSNLYAQRKVKRFVEALRSLQDVLGRLNDLAVARRLVRVLKTSDRTVLDDELKAAKRKRLETLPPVWRSFRSVEPFWR